MKGKNLRIVFMGTPEFAVASLRSIVEQGYNVVGVVTTPDRAAGRGQRLYECDVKREAVRLGLPVLQPEKLRDEEFLEALRGWRADIFIVIAFRMLPEVVWRMAPLGTFNLHASLLPQYRGAAPINHAIINGESRTGITTFLLNDKIDQGAIIGQRECDIEPSDDVGTLYERLMNMGPELVVDSIERLAEGSVTLVSQSCVDESSLHAAPKIFKTDCLIDWSWTAGRIVNFVRGLSPYPSAWCTLVNDGGESTTAKIFSVRRCEGERLAVGEIESDNRGYIKVGCADGAIEILTLQLAGKRCLATREFLLGFKGIEHYKAR